jgi:predicted CXXCH cytochrome family protein
LDKIIKMRSFLFKSCLITGFIILLLFAGSLILAVLAPFHPGNIFFPTQSFAEQQMGFIFSDPTKRASYMFDLEERRIKDLHTRIGSQYELVAIEYLDQSLDQAMQAMSLTSSEKVNDLRLRFFSLIAQTNETLKQLVVAPIQNQDVFQTFQAKILTFIQTTQTAVSSFKDPGLTSLVSSGNPRILTDSSSIAVESRGLIPFPPGSVGAVHAFFPLTGQHASLACKSCHTNQRYLGTPNTCTLCHILKRPFTHYTGECALCHTAVTWTDIHFDHEAAKAVDCSSCHESIKPANHYSGQCSACHVIQAWNIVTFNHVVAGAVDCISCHNRNAPANHYSGQCSNCHDTSNWTSVTFDHTGFVDCASCHSSITPANHFNGQCSNCHSTSTWQGVVFNHSGFTDCIGCHSADAPGNHYSGQCSSCHDPNSSWRNAQFNHNGFKDCIACHSGNAPNNHFSGQCSDCHSTNSWSGAVFSHNGLSDCASCHSGNAPKDHYSGQCSDCHSTNSWSGAVFNHDGLSDCESCHSKDRPSEHEAGQCSECHNTQRWGNVGDSEGSLLFKNGILQAVNCEECHFTNVVMVVKGFTE